MNEKRKADLFPVLLAAVIAASCIAFWFCWRFDNKYNLPRPAAKMGTIPLNMEWYGEHPFFYLADNWAFYQDRLLSPDEIAGAEPDAYLYIGQYGGFDLGVPTADPHGRGTYRTVILTDGIEREFALELTEIYSHWRLWVNGALLQSVGLGDQNAPSPGSQMVTFTAKDRIEIVVAVEDANGFYSGMVYPPAFGSPAEVSRAGLLRLLVHSAACTLAIIIGLLCLLARLSYRVPLPYAALALLCFCFCACTAWPIYQAFGFSGGIWPVVERLGTYGMLPTLMWILARIASLPKRAYYPACAIGVAICLGILLVRAFPVGSAGVLMAWSGVLTVYKWVCAGWMLAVCGWAVFRGCRYSRKLLAGACVFACALIMGKLLPLHEPILLGWFVEQAGGVLILLIGGILRYDTVRIYLERDALRTQQKLSNIQLAARAEQARLSQEYIRRTREQLHETRSRFTLVRYYLDSGELLQLSDYLDGIVPSLSANAPQGYTGHSLTDAILTYQFSKAAELDIYVEPELDPLPEQLPISDDDLTSLLINLLDNAIEGCQRLEHTQRWICFGIFWSEQELRFLCRNAASADIEDEGGTSKADKNAHGFGLPLLRTIASRYGGEASAFRDEGCFTTEVCLRSVRSLHGLSK